MPGLVSSLDIFSKFIAIAKELAKLPALVLPQYQSAAQDLYEISQKLLAANENLSRWLFTFLYFDFRNDQARSKFLDAVKDYKSMKQGPEFRQLKFSCGDISQVYYRNIQSKLGNWFSNPAKLEEAQGVFTALTDADNDMVAFTYDHVIKQLDSAIDRMENCVNNNLMDEAEKLRLQLKVEMKEITEQLETFSGELSDLVMVFADIAHVPVTLNRS